MADFRLRGVGSDSDVFAQVDSTTNALRVSPRPTEYADNGGVIGGHYRIARQSGTMASGIASAAQVFQVRWADPVKLFGLKNITIQASTGTGFAATTLGAPLELIIGHGSTANGSGGTAFAPTSSSNKMRSSMASTAFVTSGEIRIATTAALTAATGQTLEAEAIGECLGAPNSTLLQAAQQVLFDQRDNGDHPLLLNGGDTIAIRTLNPAATGTWFFTVTMAWLEVAAY